MTLTRRSAGSGGTPADVARVFRALSDPTRLRILALLRRGDRCVCEVQHALQTAQPTVSRHLAYLRRAGLVGFRRDGFWMHYERSSIATKALGPVLESAEDCVASSAIGQTDRARLNRMKPCCEHTTGDRPRPVFVRRSRSPQPDSELHGTR